MLVHFLLPLLLAVAHSACAMYVVADVVEVFGRFEIGATAAFVAACFLVVYGAYFAITYLFARHFTREWRPSFRIGEKSFKKGVARIWEVRIILTRALVGVA